MFIYKLIFAIRYRIENLFLKGLYMANPVQHLKLWQAVTRYGGLSLAEKSILMALCCYSDEAGQNAWPGYQKLIHDCCCNKRTVFAALDSLEAKQLISRAGYRQRRIVWNINTTVLAQKDHPKPERKRASRKVEKPPSETQTTDGTTPPQKGPPSPQPSAEKGHLNGQSPSPPAPDVQEGQLTPEQIAKRHEDVARLKAMLRGGGVKAMEEATFEEKQYRAAESARRYSERKEQ